MNKITIPAVEFATYAQWATDLWLSSARPLEVRDYAIMGLGLPGEVGELVEELLASWNHEELLPDLLKEFGDVLYYCARLYTAFDLEVPAEGWISHAEPVALASVQFPFAVARTGLSMVTAVGRVCEVLKKNIRDGGELTPVARAVLSESLARAVATWLDAVALVGLVPQELMALNQNKVNGRRSRGTLRGSGNNR